MINMTYLDDRGRRRSETFGGQDWEPLWDRREALGCRLISIVLTTEDEPDAKADIFVPASGELAETLRYDPTRDIWAIRALELEEVQV